MTRSNSRLRDLVAVSTADNWRVALAQTASGSVHGRSSSFSNTDRRERPAAPQGLFTIKDAAEAGGLAQPIVVQLVPRIWIDRVGLIYTAGQLRRQSRLVAASATASTRAPDDDVTLSPCMR